MARAFKLSGLLIITSLLSTATLAEGHPYVGITGGATFAAVGTQNSTIATGSSNDNYATNSSASGTSMFGVSGGYEFAGHGPIPAVALGVGVYDMPSTYNYSGQLVQTPTGGGAQSFYNYNFTINSARIMAEAQFTWTAGNFSPFINAGIGPSWIQLGSYTENPTKGTGPVTLSAFQPHTNSNLAYQVGFGVEYAFNLFKNTRGFKQNRLGLGYRYVNLGGAVFETRSSTYPYQLKTGKLQTNDVYLIYKHLF